MAIYRQTIDGETVVEAPQGDGELEQVPIGHNDERSAEDIAQQALDEYAAHLDRRHEERSSDDSLHTALAEMQGYQLKKLYGACKHFAAEGHRQSTDKKHDFILPVIKNGINNEWKRRKTLERENPEKAMQEAAERNEISERTGKPKKAPRGKPFGKGSDSRRLQEQGESGEQGEGDGEGEGENGEGEGKQGENDGKQGEMPPKETTMPPDVPLENPMDEHIRKIARAEDAKLAKGIDTNFAALARKIGSVEKIARLAKTDGKTEQKTIILKDWDKKIIEIDEITHEAMEKVLRAIAAGFKNIFLVGPAGSGKTTIAKQAANALAKILERDMPFAMQQGSVGVTESAFFGRFLPQGESGSFNYIETDFVRLYEQGGVFLGDEMDGLDANVFISLNAPLENGYMFLPNRIGRTMATRNEHFYFIGAANTYGRGADRMYMRNQLDAASLERFLGATFEVSYDRKMERALCDNKELLQECWRIRDIVISLNMRRTWGTRAILRAAQWMAAGLSMKAAIRTVLGDGWSQDDLSKIGYSGAKPVGSL